MAINVKEHLTNVLLIFLESRTEFHHTYKYIIFSNKLIYLEINGCYYFSIALSHPQKTNRSSNDTTFFQPIKVPLWGISFNQSKCHIVGYPSTNRSATLGVIFQPIKVPHNECCQKKGNHTQSLYHQRPNPENCWHIHLPRGKAIIRSHLEQTSGNGCSKSQQNPQLLKLSDELSLHPPIRPKW